MPTCMVRCSRPASQIAQQPRGGPEPDRSVSHHRRCLRHAGRADQQVRRRPNAGPDVDRELGDGRTIEAIARALNLDPIAVRRRNMLTAAELPWTMPAGPVPGGRDAARNPRRGARSLRRPGVSCAPGSRQGTGYISGHGPVLRGRIQHLWLRVLSRCRNPWLRP